MCSYLAIKKQRSSHPEKKITKKAGKWPTSKIFLIDLIKHSWKPPSLIKGGRGGVQDLPKIESLGGGDQKFW